MSQDEFTGTAWNNGGDGYGIKISAADRDQFFDETWRGIDLHIPGFSKATPVRTDKASMWKGNCRELIHKNIGLWLRSVDRAPWPKGRPPKVRLKRIGERSFQVSFV